ncbi:MAG: hypothetical protein WA797_13150 [Acidimicrobiales bacterium]
MGISAVGSIPVTAITPHERPDDMVHPEGAPVNGHYSASAQPAPERADEVQGRPGVTAEVHRNREIGVNVTEFRDVKTGEVISQIPSRQILAMAITLAEQARQEREVPPW